MKYRDILWLSVQKTAEATEVLFGLWAWIGPRNCVLDGDPDASMGRGNFEGKRADHCKVQGLSAESCAKTAELIKMVFGLWTWVHQGCTY